LTKLDTDVTRTSPKRQIGSSSDCSCVYDDQCNCKYLQTQSMTCNNLVKSYTVNGNTWSFNLTVPFSELVNGWTATVTFSAPIASLSDRPVHGTVHDVTQGPVEFQISNSTTDGVQCGCGSATTLWLEAKGVTTATAITAVAVNGHTVCTGGTPINPN
jgi:hypothetical protein